MFIIYIFILFIWYKYEAYYDGISSWYIVKMILFQLLRRHTKINTHYLSKYTILFKFDIVIINIYNI